MYEIKQKIINSKYININISSKDIGNSIIVFINSENKSKLLEMINEYNNQIFIQTIKKYKDDLNNQEKKLHPLQLFYISLRLTYRNNKKRGE